MLHYIFDYCVLMCLLKFKILPNITNHKNHLSIKPQTTVTSWLIFICHAPAWKWQKCDVAKTEIFQWQYQNCPICHKFVPLLISNIKQICLINCRNILFFSNIGFIIFNNSFVLSLSGIKKGSEQSIWSDLCYCIWSLCRRCYWTAYRNSNQRRSKKGYIYSKTEKQIL